jgi:putative oxidoreductase
MSTLTSASASASASTETTTATTSRKSVATNAVQSAFRVVVGFLFTCHGAMGFGLLGGIDGQGTAVPFGSWPGYWATLIETAVGILVATGLFTRAAAILGSGTMAYAYFTVHAPLALLPLQNQGEQAALFSWIFLLIAIQGPGRYALDTLRRR